MSRISLGHSSIGFLEPAPPRMQFIDLWRRLLYFLIFSLTVIVSIWDALPVLTVIEVPVRYWFVIVDNLFLAGLLLKLLALFFFDTGFNVILIASCPLVVTAEFLSMVVVSSGVGYLSYLMIISLFSTADDSSDLVLFFWTASLTTSCLEFLVLVSKLL